MNTIQSHLVLYEIGNTKRIKKAFAPIQIVFDPCELIYRRVPQIYDLCYTIQEAEKKSNCNEAINIEFV